MRLAVVMVTVIVAVPPVVVTFVIAVMVLVIPMAFMVFPDHSGRSTDGSNRPRDTEGVPSVPQSTGSGGRLVPSSHRPSSKLVSQPDHAVSHILTGSELSEIWTRLDVLLWAEFLKLSPSEWLQRHQGISPDDFFREPHRNRYTSLLGRTAHLAYHYGQAVLAKHK